MDKLLQFFYIQCDFVKVKKMEGKREKDGKKSIFCDETCSFFMSHLLGKIIF